MAETLKEKTAKGLFWSGMNSGTQQLVGLVFGIVLGRLLSPQDYGMTGMIAIFPLIATTLQNSGFKTALVNLPSPTHADYNSVFWFNIIVGITLYVVLFFCAPLIASYFHTPELTALCRYSFVGFLLAALGAAQAAYMIKQLRMKEVAKSGMTAVLLSSITGVVMAYKGCAYWSLATQGIVFIGVNTALLWWFSDWRPSLTIDFGPVRRMFGFSVKIMLASIMTQVNNNVMNILLGRYYRASDVGFYNQAYQWNSKCYSLIQGMVTQVDQPVLVGLEAERSRQLQALRKLVRLTAFTAFPLLLGFGLVAHEFIVLAITEKWAFSARLLQLLCIGGAFMPLSALLSDVTLSHRRSDVYMWCTAILCVATLATVLLMSPFGILAMVKGYVVVSVMGTFLWFSQVHRFTGYRLLHFLKDILPFALAAAAVMAVTYLLTKGIANLWLLISVRVVVAAQLYYAVMAVCGARIMTETRQFLLSKFRRR